MSDWDIDGEGSSKVWSEPVLSSAYAPCTQLVVICILVLSKLLPIKIFALRRYVDPQASFVSD